MPKPLPPTVSTTVRDESGDAHHVEIGSMVQSRSREGAVQLCITQGAQVMQIQMDLPKAREIVGMLNGAIEAAVSDALLFKFLTTKIALSESAAASALVDFRAMRQGSRGTVYPV